jgi:hypothetical protein
MTTHVDVEVTPFVDAGRVFGDLGTFPFDHLHTIGGIGFRGIARPFVVGYVDVGRAATGSRNLQESATPSEQSAGS